eukprot:jgi/Chlat1/1953/Chrsp157S02260
MAAAVAAVTAMPSPVAAAAAGPQRLLSSRAVKLPRSSPRRQQQARQQRQRRPTAAALSTQRQEQEEAPVPSSSSSLSVIKEEQEEDVQLDVLTARERLLELVGRLEQGSRGAGAAKEDVQEVNSLVAVLEEDGGMADPALSRAIEGRWRLAFLTRPGSASPIQRTFTSVGAFRVYQEISLITDDHTNNPDPRVSNVVVFGDRIGELRVQAAASVAPDSGSRIDFRFDRAAFEFKFLPFKVPYPVPFKLLGKEAEGWLDTTYLSPALRLSRGNKGSLFVLVKDDSPKERLLKAIETSSGVQEVRGGESLVTCCVRCHEQAIDELVPLNPSKAPARDRRLKGRWQQLWTSQGKNANRLQKLVSNASKNYQVIDDEAGDGRLLNIAEVAGGIAVVAEASYSVSSSNRVDVEIDTVRIKLGPLNVPLGLKGEGYVDQLYLDETLRVSQGNKGSVFIHKKLVCGGRV